MAATTRSFGLKDLLSPSPASNSKLIVTKKLLCSIPQFEKLSSVEGSVSSLTLRSSSSSLSPLTFPMSLASDQINRSLKYLQKNLGKEKVEADEGAEGNNASYHQRNLGKEMEDTEKKQLTCRKCFPPPISCLRNIKVGKPYRYLAYDKESQSHVVKEIKIPKGSLFHACRENGRLKLYLAYPDEGDSKGN